MPLGAKSDSIPAGEQPRRGITKEQVIAEFGEPDSTHGPTGKPPIYYWEYPDFTVYFEGEHVIHAVSKRKAVKYTP